jgi:hypothetical protein
MKFNRYLLSLPKEKRKYIIAVSLPDKSYRWVAKLAEKYLQIAPVEIIDFNSLYNEYKPEDSIRHIVIIDDASYSGNQSDAQLKAHRDKGLVQNNNLINLQFHCMIPFMTDFAKAKSRNGLTGRSFFSLVKHMYYSEATLTAWMPSQIHGRMPQARSRNTYVSLD